MTLGIPNPRLYSLESGESLKVIQTAAPSPAMGTRKETQQAKLSSAVRQTHSSGASAVLGRIRGQSPGPVGLGLSRKDLLRQEDLEMRVERINFSL